LNREKQVMDNPDSIMMGIAAQQHGIVARWQLLAAGVPAHVIENRQKSGRLQRLHRCVYRLAPLTGPWEREMGAVLSCGRKAALSHRGATALLGLLPRCQGDIAVSVGCGHPRVRDGVRLYRVPLPAADMTTVAGVPVTTGARTLLDVASIVTPRELEQAAAQALEKRLVTEAEIARMLERYPSRPGARELRALLASSTPPALARSEAEEQFLAMLRRGQLPVPAVNVYVGGFMVDFYWRTEALVVEIDGFAFHSSRRAMARDRQRDASLTAAGCRVMRFTWADVTRTREATLVRVAQALARSPPTANRQRHDATR
jgi:very-short-patch-repair endonuclease/predicted transcriptional regulator of viral defense system